jgi:hypothetical protein
MQFVHTYCVETLHGTQLGAMSLRTALTVVTANPDLDLQHLLTGY